MMALVNIEGSIIILADDKPCVLCGKLLVVFHLELLTYLVLYPSGLLICTSYEIVDIRTAEPSE